jgi:NodT family efflux transporter outer membrane factor (OMF) lipoprotein
LALALTACVSGPDYVAPSISMSEKFMHAGVGATTGATNSATLETWWRGFNDPELTTIIERVRQQNLDLDIAFARVQQARASANMGEAALLPKGEAGLQTASERQSLQSPIGILAKNFPGYQRNVTLYDSGVGASWEADLSGGLRRAKEASIADEQATEAEQLGVRVMVQADAADAYFRIRGAQRRIELALGQIKDDSDLLEIVNLRLKEGLSTRQEQAEAEARLAQVRASVPPLRSELDMQLNRLDVLMGAQPGTWSAKLGASMAQIVTPEIAGTLQPKDLLSRRPDVIAAERRLAAANARIGVASSEYYPKFSLSAMIGFEGLNSAAWKANNFQPQALTGIHWRLFDFGRVDAEVAQAKGAHAEALARYRYAMLKATEEVENALSMQTQLTSERRELVSEVEADQRARQASQDAYQGGVTGIMELLEQDRQLLAARDQYLIAETGAARATVATYRALGGGW